MKNSLMLIAYSLQLIAKMGIKLITMPSIYNYVMKEITKQWLEFVDKDINAAKDLINDPKHAEIVAFHLQQALEKSVKAYIYEKTDKVPPKIHNLRGLASIGGLELSEYEIRLLDKLNFVYTEARYPQSVYELKDFLKEANLNEIYNETERLIKWIKSKL